MTKAWLITTGEYSDYEVHFVALSEEIAKAYCEQENAQPYTGYHQYEYEAFEVLEVVPAPGDVVWMGSVEVPPGTVSIYGELFSGWRAEQPLDEITYADLRKYGGSVKGRYSAMSRDRERLEQMLKQSVVDHWAKENVYEFEDGTAERVDTKKAPSGP